MLTATKKRGAIFLVRYPDLTGASRIAAGHMLHLSNAGYSVGMIYAVKPADTKDGMPNHFLDELESAGVVAVCEGALWAGISLRLLKTIKQMKVRINANVNVGVNQRDRPVACLAGRVVERYDKNIVGEQFKKIVI